MDTIKLQAVACLGNSSTTRMVKNLIVVFLILSNRDQFTCAYHCNKLDESCANFADTLTTEDCKAITDNGQGLVKTSKLNQNAVRVWSNQEVQKGL